MTRNTLRQTRVGAGQNAQRLIANTPANPQTTAKTTTKAPTEEEQLQAAIAMSLAAESGAGGGQEDSVDPNTDPELAQALALSRQESALSSGGNKPNPAVVDLTGVDSGGDDLQATLLASIQTAQGRTPVISSDPTTLERVANTPVGLKNVGNTCYLNSLIQTYFMMPIIRKAIVSYKPAQAPPAKSADNKAPAENFDHHSHDFMIELQKLFCAMILSRQRFVDPSSLLKKIVDEGGKVVNIGAQEDVSEFNDIFMMRLTKGLDLMHPPVESSSVPSSPAPHSHQQSSNAVSEPGSANLSGSANLASSNSNAMETDPTSLDAHFPSASVSIAPLSPAPRSGGNLRISTPDPHDPALSTSIMLYPDVTDLTNARLQRMFQPNVLETVEARELDGTHIQQQQMVDFGRNFILPVSESENELYSSLDKFMSDEVADWETPKKARVTANRWRWLRRAPEVLFFQQQRAVWRGDAYTKANAVLKFPETLFMERYNWRHLDEATSIRAANASRYAQLQDLQKQIEPYMHFDTEGTPLDNVLAGSIKYLSTLVESGSSRNADQIDLMKRSIDLLRERKEEEAKTLTSLSSEKESVEKTLTASFNALQTEPYTLFAVWVHAGVANGGHYWAYIKDAASGEWFKFNDTDCTRVDINKVLEDGYGGQGVTSAYFLIYMKETLYDRSKTLERWDEIVPQNLRLELESDNAAFEKKLKEFRENGVDSKIERFVQNYDRKWEQAQEYASTATNEKDMRYFSVFAYLLSRGLEEDSQAALASEMWLRIFGAGISKEQTTVQFERLLTMPTPGTATLFRAVNWNSKERDAEYKNFRSVFAFTQHAVSLLQKSDSPPPKGLTEKQEALRLLYLAYLKNLEVKPDNCKRNDLAELIQLAIVLCLREAIELAAANLDSALAVFDDVSYVCMRLGSSSSNLVLVPESDGAQVNPGLVFSHLTVPEEIKALIIDACFTSLPEKNPAFADDQKALIIQDRLIGDAFPADRRWESYAVPAMPTELDQWEAYIISARDSYVRLKKKFAGVIPSYNLTELSIFGSEKKCTTLPPAQKKGDAGKAGSNTPATVPSTPTLPIAETEVKTEEPASSTAMDTSEHEAEKMVVDTPDTASPQNPDAPSSEKPSESTDTPHEVATKENKPQSSVSISNAMDVDQSPKKE